ncbi:MAG: hypothetical protein PHY28_04385 [Dehalococcoidales bacterium]|nr:hypothetical protein [Dehalococcoidales bacterium]
MIYQWRKGIATWVKGSTLHISVPFTWLMEDAEKMKAKWKGDCVIGGSGLMLPSEYTEFEPLILHNACATFTTRGCINNCSFCAVPKLEGEFREIPDFRPAPLICDNNLLASSKKHLRRVVDSLKQFPFVDFNQGLEAKLFTPEIADILGELKCKVRFAFDHIGLESTVRNAIDLCRERTTKDIQVYCLIGFNDTPDDARNRLELIRSWGAMPNPMRYQPITTTKKDSFVAPRWTDRQLTDMVRYYSRLNWLGHIPFNEYKQVSQGVMELANMEAE